MEMTGNLLALSLIPIIAGSGPKGAQRGEVNVRAKLVEVDVSKVRRVDQNYAEIPYFNLDGEGMTIGFVCEHPLMRSAETYGELELTEGHDANGKRIEPYGDQTSLKVYPRQRIANRDKCFLGTSFRFPCPPDLKGPLTIKGRYKIHCKAFKTKLVRGFAKGHTEMNDHWTFESDGMTFEFSRNSCELQVYITNADSVEGLGMVDEEGRAVAFPGPPMRVMMGDRVYFMMDIGCYEIGIYDLQLMYDIRDMTVIANIDEDGVPLPK